MGRKSLAKQRREQIVQALNRCIAKYGLQNTSIKKIAEEAGVQPGLLHHYFEDRDEIVEELVKTIVDEVAAKYLEEIRRHDDPETRFEKAISFLFGSEMINDEYAGFFFDSWAEARRNPRIRESFGMLYERFRKAIVDLLVHNEEFSGLSPKDVEELATVIIAIQDGVSLQRELSPDHVPLGDMSRITRRMVELYVHDRVHNKKRPAARASRGSPAGRRGAWNKNRAAES